MLHREAAGTNSDGQNSRPAQTSKHRRLPGACDSCRKRKIRCDSARRPGNPCTNCVEFDVECTHIGFLSQKKRNAESSEINTTLGERLRKVESLLTQIHPELDYNDETGNYELLSQPLFENSEIPAANLVGQILENQQRSRVLQDVPENTRALVVQLAEYARRLESQLQNLQGRRLLTRMELTDDDTMVEVQVNNLTLSGSATNTLVEVEDDTPSTIGNTANLNRLSDKNSIVPSTYQPTINSDPTNNRFFGKSSDLNLLESAFKAKLDIVGATSGDGITSAAKGFNSRRPLFWSMHPYPPPSPVSLEGIPTFDFPDGDILSGLIDDYFTYVNDFMPLLHKPTFCANVADNLQSRDQMFAGVLLMVCTLGSIYSDDPRVFQEGISPPQTRGFPFFYQIYRIRKNVMDVPTLYELQMYCLMVLFFHGACGSPLAWTVIGIGLRYAQEVGAHRKKKNGVPSPKNELWKRAFWCLVIIDRILASFTGRPCGTSEEDFDAEMPIECDDEYWNHGFIQPPGKPSKIGYFNSLISLTKVLGRASRTIYAVRKPPSAHLSQMASELDSDLNAWVDLIPSYLRWDPVNNADSLFFAQSASLYTTYYLIQMHIHRLFVPKPSQTSLPSLLICANAARACVGVMDAYRSREPTKPPFPYVMITVFTSGVMLLLNHWASIKAERTPDTKDIKIVHKCLDILQQYENRWRSIGRIWDILNGLASNNDAANVVSSHMVNHTTFQSLPHTAFATTQSVGISSPSSGSSPFFNHSSSMHGFQRSSQPVDSNSYPSPFYTSQPSVMTATSDENDEMFDANQLFGDLQQDVYSNAYQPAGSESLGQIFKLSPSPDLPGLGDWWQSYFATTGYEFSGNPFSAPSKPL